MEGSTASEMLSQAPCPGTTPLDPAQPLSDLLLRQLGRLGLTCAVVQKTDASVVMGGDGEGLAGVTHHLVDLGWA